MQESPHMEIWSNTASYMHMLSRQPSTCKCTKRNDHVLVELFQSPDWLGSHPS